MHLRSWLVLAVLLATCSRAVAQEVDATAAKALFDEGNSLYKAGRYELACAKLQASWELNPLIGTRGRLAECFEKQGKLASAWTAWRDVAAMGAASNNNTDRQRAKYAEQRVAALHPTLGTLAIEVPTASRLPGLEVLRDGSVVPVAMWGTVVPSDSGVVRIAATAPGYEPWQDSVSIADGSGVVVRVPALSKRALEQPPVDERPAPTADDSPTKVASLTSESAEPTTVLRQPGPTAPAAQEGPLAFGVLARADIDPDKSTASPLIGLALQFGGRAELNAGAVLGSSRGPFSGLRLYPFRGQLSRTVALRPALSVTVPLYMTEEGTFVGVLAQAGLELKLDSPRGPVSLRADVGQLRLFSAPANYDDTLFVVTAGLAWYFVR